MATVTDSPPTLPTELDPFRVEHLDDPYPLYAQLRRRGPAVYLPERDVWFVSRYDAVDEVLRRYKDFRSGLGTSYIRVADSGFRFPFIDNDPPEHSRVRRSVQRHFGRGPTEQLRPRVRELVDGLVEPALAAGEADIVTAFSRPLPDLTMREVTGIEPTDPDKVAAWADAVFHVLGPEPDPRYLELTMEGLGWLGEQGVPALPEHCLGALIMHAGGDTGGLADAQERLLALASIWMAGIDTTNGLISNAFNAFADHPAQWDAVRDDPDLVPAAVEEVLRWDSPIRMFLRRTVDDVELQGVTIPADANVCALFPAANRDPDAFVAADDFDVTARREPTHLAFGASVHLCLGAPIARLELAELLDALRPRVARFEHAGPAVRATSRVIRNFSSLPIRFVSA